MTHTNDKRSPDDIVFTGIGMITSAGYGFSASLKALENPPERQSLEDYWVKGFNPAPYLTDRKVVKVVSPRDVLGLVAFEECVKHGLVRHDKMDHERTGLYVGAPPSATTDNMNYAEAVEATRNAYGELVEAEFGQTFRNASPTTLLSGLPNNVLCYGSKTLDARGPNSNYTAMETSAHLSIFGAARAMRLGRLDCAIAGGFSAHTDSVMTTSMRRRGLQKKGTSRNPFQISPFGPADDAGTITADGAAFVSLEKRSLATERQANIFASLLAGRTASDAQWPFRAPHSDKTLTDLLVDSLHAAGVDPKDVSLIALSGSGIADIDAVEKQAVTSVFGRAGELPTLMCSTPVWGNLMEAGGIGEIGVMANVCATGKLPKAVAVDFGMKQRELTAGLNQVGVVLRASATNEFTCMVLRFESDVLVG